MRKILIGVDDGESNCVKERFVNRDKPPITLIPPGGCDGNLRELLIHGMYNGKRFQLGYLIVCEKCNCVIRGIDTGSMEGLIDNGGSDGSV